MSVPSWFGDLMTFGGAALVAAGLWAIYPPVAVIAVGAAVGFLGVKAALK